LKTQQRTFFDVENLDLEQALACASERVSTSSRKLDLRIGWKRPLSK